MDSNVIREKFLAYFKELDHTILPGSSLIPEEPSLLLTTAGMVQFIPIFRGDRKPKHKRVATVQRCLRTTDIDKIGHTARHLTFFEMLGNFSFGDYYKKEVIPWAWRFVTEELKIDPARLWVSVFLDDDESFRVWEKDVGMSPHRIVRLGEEENFWSMGPTGPCGPCSEIHYDFGEELACGPECAVGCDCDRFLEVWNLVFMQYNRDENGELAPLPKKNIDTGMGLERVAAITQGVSNTFESDLLKDLIDKIVEISGKPYGRIPSDDVSLKIVADHTRAFTFMINDGVLPSNEGRGYVLRRLIRRAVRHARRLGITEPFLVGLGHQVIDDMADAYPDVGKNRKFILEIVKDEEERFGRTIKGGLQVLNGFLADAEKMRHPKLEAAEVFKLYETYGFPPELTIEIAAERGLAIDAEAVERQLAEHREQAREAAGETARVETAPVFAKILEESGETVFEGYDKTRIDSPIVALVRGGKRIKKAETGDEVTVFLRDTPFYAEMGGQVGDTGTISSSTGIVKVSKTEAALTGLTAHVGSVANGSVKEGQGATAAIDTDKRQDIRRNHTATHLLHWALRMILGEHVRQGGSHVDDRRLRFDFTHGRGLSAEEVERIETVVNKKIIEDNPVRAYTTTYKYAVESGALAFFGEKYGKEVRVLEVGDYSRELCGGTHVARTGQIGQLRITGESSIGANLRRIEAVTGLDALDFARRNEEILAGVEGKLKAGRDSLESRIDRLLTEVKKGAKETAAGRAKKDSAEAARLLEGADQHGDTKVIVSALSGRTPDELRAMADEIRNRDKRAVIVLGSKAGSDAYLIIALGKDIAGKPLDAVELIRDAAAKIGGGGGGRKDLAQAGGKKAAGLTAALNTARQAALKSL